MEFGVLGPVQVGESGRVLDLGVRKQRMLLGLLLRSAGTPLSADQIVDRLWWQERPPASAASNLRVYIHNLRRTLGKDRITYDRRGYLVELEPGELDVERFDDLVAQGRDAAVRGSVCQAGAAWCPTTRCESGSAHS